MLTKKNAFFWDGSCDLPRVYGELQRSSCGLRESGDNKRLTNPKIHE